MGREMFNRSMIRSQTFSELVPHLHFFSPLVEAGWVELNKVVLVP